MSDAPRLGLDDLRRCIDAGYVDGRDAEIIRLRLGLGDEQSLSLTEIGRRICCSYASARSRYNGAMARLAESLFSGGPPVDPKIDFDSPEWAVYCSELSQMSANLVKKHGLSVGQILNLGVDGLQQFPGIGTKVAHEIMLVVTDDGFRMRHLFPGLPVAAMADPNP